MNFIEQIFGVNLDGGSGLFELVLLLVLCAVVYLPSTLRAMASDDSRIKLSSETKHS